MKEISQIKIYSLTGFSFYPVMFLKDTSFFYGCSFSFEILWTILFIVEVVIALSQQVKYSILVPHSWICPIFDKCYVL